MCKCEGYAAYGWTEIVRVEIAVIHLLESRPGARIVCRRRKTRVQAEAATPLVPVVEHARVESTERVAADTLIVFEDQAEFRFERSGTDRRRSGRARRDRRDRRARRPARDPPSSGTRNTRQARRRAVQDGRCTGCPALPPFDTCSNDATAPPLAPGSRAPMRSPGHPTRAAIWGAGLAGSRIPIRLFTNST